MFFRLTYARTISPCFSLRTNKKRQCIRILLVHTGAFYSACATFCNSLDKALFPLLFLLSRFWYCCYGFQNGNHFFAKTCIINVQNIALLGSLIRNSLIRITHDFIQAGKNLHKYRIISHQQDRLIIHIHHVFSEHLSIANWAYACNLLTDIFNKIQRSAHAVLLPNKYYLLSADNLQREPTVRKQYWG